MSAAGAANLASFKNKPVQQQIVGSKEKQFSGKSTSVGQISRSFSVNRAFKDITQKVLNSSGAAVIQRTIPSQGSRQGGSVGTRPSDKMSTGNYSQSNATGNENVKRRTSPSVGSTNQQPTKQINQMPHKSITNRNPAGVEPTIKRGVGAFGSQASENGLPDFTSHSDFRFQQHNRLDKDFKHAPIIKQSRESYQKSSNNSNLQIMHPAFNDSQVGSTALSSTNKNLKASTSNRNNVFGPQILKNSQTQKNSTANIHKSITSPMNALNLQAESKFKSKAIAEEKSKQAIRMSQSSREKLPGISTHQKAQMHEQRCENMIFRHIQKIDRRTLTNPHHVSEYCKEIQESMLKSEQNWSPDPNYMQKQHKLDESIRSTLVDWLIQIHYNFKFWPETLFLIVNTIDRYFSKNVVKEKREVQLVGLAAALMVSKYEEIYPPTLKDFCYVANEIYSQEEVLQMERQILMAIDFDVSQCSSYRFLERYSKLGKCDTVTFLLAQYMLELGLLDSKMSQFSQSLQAISAIYTAQKYQQQSDKTVDSSAGSMAKGGVSSTSKSTFCLSDMNTSNYSMEQVRSCAKCFNQLASLIQKSKLQNVVKKFKTSKMYEVARIVHSVGNSKVIQSTKKHQQDERKHSFSSLPSNQKTQNQLKPPSSILNSHTAVSSSQKRGRDSAKRTASQPGSKQGQKSAETRENSLSGGQTAGHDSKRGVSSGITQFRGTEY